MGAAIPPAYLGSEFEGTTARSHTVRTPGKAWFCGFPGLVAIRAADTFDQAERYSLSKARHPSQNNLDRETL
jgi:hypothetical protein